MKRLALLTLVAAALLPAHAQTNVSVSIGINVPGQYGRIDIDNYPRPVLVAPQPIVYAPTPVAVYQRPVYLYVPQTHRVNWGHHCAQYGACAQPVYFVRESWVREQYERERHAGKGHGKGHGNGKGSKGHGHGHGKD
jgi:hypothetical protein